MVPLYDHRMVRGDNYSFNLTITTDGVATNLTGGTLRMTVKRLYIDIDADATLALTSPSAGITITNAVGGLATVNITPIKTSNLPAHRQDLVYDIQFTDVSGVVSTIVMGKFIILPDASILTP